MEDDKKNDNFIGGLLKDTASMTSCFQKYRQYVIIFVISMPINCVILEVEVNLKKTIDINVVFL